MVILVIFMVRAMGKWDNHGIHTYYIYNIYLSLSLSLHIYIYIQLCDMVLPENEGFASQFMEKLMGK